MANTHKICSVFGTNSVEITDHLKEKLHSTFIDLITKYNVRTFYFGGLSSFDDVCWQIVSGLKNQYNNIKRVFCLSNRNWLNPSKRPQWLNNNDYEEIVYFELSFNYWYTRIYYRNCEMINRSDYLVFYAPPNPKSGAYKALKYALSKKKSIINLYDTS